jgi:hypothetical protein
MQPIVVMLDSGRNRRLVELQIERASVASTGSRSISKAPSTAGTLALKPLDERGECCWLWQRHDCLERQWSAVGVVTVHDPADRMAENLDR